MENSTPQAFDRPAAIAYLKQAAVLASLPNDADRDAVVQHFDQPVVVAISIGDGRGVGVAWGCDLSYDYVKINAEYTT
ncbi:MAG: bifunctional ornithine acetyltransferase/N-acetylglutamate synthase, partial [Thermosynechococcaceae cyanobacterium]